MKSILILAAATLALTTGSAGANDSSHYYIAKGSSCASGPTGATAKVSMLMYADPFLRTYATNFILHTRLIPHGQTLPGRTGRAPGPRPSAHPSLAAGRRPGTS